MNNASEILNNVNKCLEELEISGYGKRTTYKGTNVCFLVREVCEELSIFDWWRDELSKSQLLQMKRFLKTAIKLGFDGYVCFQVGAACCSNGMWAYKEEGKVEGSSVYSPDGDAIYRSFTPDYTYWSFNKNGKWLPDGNTRGTYDSLKTAKMLEEALANA